MTDTNTEAYLRYIEDANRREMSNSDTYDKSLLNLSSVLLGVSLTFTQNVVPIESARYIWCLLASWTLFALSIIAVIVSFIYGQHAIKTLKDAARAYFLDDDTSKNDFSERVYNSIRNINILAGAMFILGVVSLMGYVSLNILEQKQMSNQSQPKRIERSQPPSTFKPQQTRPNSPPSEQPQSPPQSENEQK